MEKRKYYSHSLKARKTKYKNYRPVSLLLISGEIFERLIFTKMFIYFSANKLISKNQSGFQPGHSCINQLLSITNEISTSFDNGLEVRGAFLDISIFKLKLNGISGELLHILSDFLSNRK